MTSILGRQILATVVGTANRLGAKLPKTVTADLDALVAVEARARAFRTDQLGDNLGYTVVAALEAGIDPLDDPAVMKALLRRTLTSTDAGTEAALADRGQRCIDAHVLPILEALRGPFNHAAATIVAARAQLGGLDLDDAPAVLALGGDAPRRWSEAQSAIGVIADVVKTWKLLAQVTTRVTWDRRHTALILASPDADDYIDALPEAGVADAWAIAGNGWPFDLASPDTFRQRTAAVTQAQTRRAEAGRTEARAAAQDSWRTLPRTGGVA